MHLSCAQPFNIFEKMKEYKIIINGNEYNTAVSHVEDGKATVTVNGQQYDNVTVEGMAKKAKPAKAVVRPTIASTDSYPSGAKTAAPSAVASASAIKSPLPGVILDVYVKEGDSVKMGQKLMMLEAMKMENNIESDKEGVVKTMPVRKGDSVLEGDVLITIE